MIEPSGVGQIPVDGFFEAVFERSERFPSQLFFKPTRVDGIAEIVSLAVSDIINEVEAMPLGISEFTVDDFYENLH